LLSGGAWGSTPFKIEQEIVKMKKITLACVLLLTLALSTGCMVTSFGGFGANTVQGTGPMVSRDFDILNFTGINISGGYTVVYRHAQAVSVTVSMQENLFDYLNVGVRNGVLFVDSDRSFRTSSSNTPRLYVYAPMIDSVTVSGAITTNDWDTINAPSFYINVGGAATATIDMNVEELDITVAGAATLYLSGNATVANLSIAGAGTLNGENLQTRDATISLAGTGNAELAVSDNLNVSISGVGNVWYIGSPNVTQTIAGMGRVRSRD